LRLVIVGDGSQRPLVEGILREHKVQDLAWLPGERSDIPDVMRGLDVFALPSLSEGISNTVLEAMSCGLPVIATAVGGNVELVCEGVTGHLVPRADPSAMAAAMLRLLDDPLGARNMGDGGRALAVARFSLSAMASAYESLYESLLSVHGRTHFAGERRT
jgi:glycosyltransferase involved in cell wall biosynthesis